PVLNTSTPPPARPSRWPSPGTTAGSSHTARGICPRRCPVWTRPSTGTGSLPCRCSSSPPTGAPCCWLPGCPLTPWPRRTPRRVTALARAQGWLAEALRAGAAGDRRRLLAACGRGLDILDEHQVTLGASELRAQATAHGAELAALAQRAALGTGRPRLMLSWSERWRATAHAIPAARPADDADLQADLTGLRDVT